MTSRCIGSASTTAVQMFWIATLLLATTTEAWAPRPVPRNGDCLTAGHYRRGGFDRRLPAMAMFDWFNPKPKPAAAPQQDEGKKEDTKSSDFLTSFFNQEPSTNSNNPKEEPKVESPPPPAATSTSTTTTETVTGKVKWYNPKKGFGFIITTATEAEEPIEIFVHQSQIQAPGFRVLMEGEAVEFRINPDESGRPRAEHVTGPKGGDLQVAIRRKARLEMEQQQKQVGSQ